MGKFKFCTSQIYNYNVTSSDFQLKFYYDLDEVKQLVTDIKNKKLKPIYFLMGEEAYYIDKISDFIEDTVLAEEERALFRSTLWTNDRQL